MATFAHTELILDSKFDAKQCRRMLNGWVSVLHCHHYTALYTQLACDCGFMDAKQLLADVSEDTFFDILTDYFEEMELEELEDRLSIAMQYYAAIGLGRMSIDFAGPDSGEVSLAVSHVDAGWLKKWGQHDQPINFVTCGYLAAVFAAVFDRAPRSYRVHETASIVCGAPTSKFSVVAV